MRAHIRELTLLALAAALAVLPARAALAAPPAQAPFANGTVVALSGTPHLWFADEAGVLHWGGDTRGLAGREIDWNNRREATLDQIRGYQRGDPWLSAGLLKLGDPIYLVKWETGEARPRLLHILSIRDVELFGINGENYGSFVLERGLWEQRYGIDVDTLQRSQLTPADTAGSAGAGGVIAADTFDNPAAGILPAGSSTPAAAQRGYDAGEYLLRKVDPAARINVSAALPGTHGNAALAVDVRLIGGVADRYVNLACRRGTDTEPKGYILSFRPEAGRFSIQRSDGATFVLIVPWQESAAIRRDNQTNRAELRCAGNAISASFNGTQAASVQDGAYAEGTWWVGVSASNATVEARLDNLVFSRP
jgi:hypothetical protein